MENRKKEGAAEKPYRKNYYRKPKKADYPPKAEAGEEQTPSAPKKPSPSAARRPDNSPARAGNAGKPKNKPQNKQKNPENKQNKPQNKSHGKIRVFMLGGLQEIGKNLGVIEYENEILIVDCGIAFPDDDMPGVDLVVPDISYLEKNKENIRGLVLTHGHEDHIGGVPYLLRAINPTIYGTRLTIGILQHKLEEHKLENKPDLRTVEAGDRIKLGSFTVEFIHANHSIADACCLSIETPAGVIFHTGDYKLDVSPIDGNMMDLTRIGEIGNKGVLLMMGESTNAERPGFTPSERKVGGSLEDIFTKYKDKRLVIATFSSNIHRVQQIIDASVRHGRKVAVLGRSMEAVALAAVELGYMKMPEGTLVDAAGLKRYKPNELTLITTGSQGEPMSALYRMAFDEHDKVHLSPDDVVVLSASAIPGNEKLVGKVINALVRNGIKIINDSVADVHVSGHACQEELKLMLALVKPRYFMPIHGEYRHLYANKELAEFMGIPSEHIFVSELGKVLEIDSKGARFAGTVPAGNVLVDGSGIGDVGNVVLRDRKHLSQDGLIVVVASVDEQSGMVLSGPDIISRGFVYVKESEELMDAARQVVCRSLDVGYKINKHDYASWKTRIRDDLGRFLFAKTKRNPMILPVIMTL